MNRNYHRMLVHHNLYHKDNLGQPFHDQKIDQDPTHCFLDILQGYPKFHL